MQGYLLLLTTTLLLPAETSVKSEYVDYCYLPCDNIMHTLCNSDCLSHGCLPLDPDQTWRTRIVDQHNRLRQRVASGGETRGGNSEAANMAYINYDMRLEYESACWIYEANAPRHDFCRRSVNFTRVGQNIWIGQEDVTTPEGVEAFMSSWYGQVNSGKKEMIDSYYKPYWMMFYGYFTQLVWAKTSHVGCGRCLVAGNNLSLVACNYGPGGNQPGEPVYVRGPPASLCPNGTAPNGRYPGLCGSASTPAGFDETGVLRNSNSDVVTSSAPHLCYYLIICTLNGFFLI